MGDFHRVFFVGGAARRSLMEKAVTQSQSTIHIPVRDSEMKNGRGYAGLITARKQTGKRAKA